VTLEESLAWLYSTQQFGIKLGLENIRRLLHALGDPQEKLSFIHVAGTNGKGSVCAMLDAILCESGRRTGLYTSPHLIDFRERVRVNGVKITESEAAEGLTEIRARSAGWDHSPTFFEITTALALWQFARKECEIVVLETGMGGRLDATNAVTPLVSVITPIALDHTQWLGKTLAEVAAEKAGIIKPGVPVVSAAQDAAAGEVMAEYARKAGSRAFFVDRPLEDREIGLRGAHQQENAVLAAAALEAAGFKIDQGVIAEGLRKVRWPGRFQVFQDRLVLDGSHNPHAARQLAGTWREVYGAEKPMVIFGALADKDYVGILRALEPIAAEFLFVPVQNPRAAAPSDLAAECAVSCRVFDSVRAALDAAQGRALITGSLFLVGEAMQELGIEV